MQSKVSRKQKESLPHFVATARLREERQLRGLSLVDVCRMTGIAPGDLSNVERGRQTAFPSWRQRIAEAFGLPEETLFQEVVNDS